MIFIETEECYRRRVFKQQRQRDEEIRKRRVAHPHPIEQIIYDILRENDNDPTKITTIANEAVKRMDFRGRAEREQRKLEVFKRVGGLIQIGKLERRSRKFIVIPGTDARHQAYLNRIEQMVAKLPQPQI